MIISLESWEKQTSGVLYIILLTVIITVKVLFMERSKTDILSRLLLVFLRFKAFNDESVSSWGHQNQYD